MANSDILQIFLNHCAIERGLSKNTVNAYRRDLTKLCQYLDELGVELTKASAADLQKFAAGLRSTGLSASSMARHVVAIRSFFRFLAKDLGIADISLDLIPPKIPKRLPKALSISQISDLINTCDDSITGLRDKAILETLYATGARVSEVVSLNVEDIEKSSDEIITVKVKGKGGKHRLVPLGKYAQKAIDQYLVRSRPGLIKGRRESALFVNENQGTRLSRQSTWNVVKKAASNAGIKEDVSPHALRHSFATHLLDGGADIRVVQELLGHASVTTTQIYTLVTIDKLRESYISSHPRSK